MWYIVVGSLCFLIGTVFGHKLGRLEWMSLVCEMLENGEDVERVFVWVEDRYGFDLRPYFAPDEENEPPDA